MTTATAPRTTMTAREAIERNGKLSPLAKLILEWLSRQPKRVHSAKEIGDALGVMNHDVASECYGLRAARLVAKDITDKVDGKTMLIPLPLSSLLISDEARAAYHPKKDTK